MRGNYHALGIEAGCTRIPSTSTTISTLSANAMLARLAASPSSDSTPLDAVQSSLHIAVQLLQARSLAVFDRRCRRREPTLPPRRRHSDDKVPRVLAKEHLKSHARHHPGRLNVQPVSPAPVLLDHAAVGAQDGAVADVAVSSVMDAQAIDLHHLRHAGREIGSRQPLTRCTSRRWGS
jgi:hypothetical protein